MQEPQTENRPMVIVIDDDEAMRHSLEWLIGSAGHAVLGYASAQDYLDDDGRDGTPDCVILDVHMPKINGLEMYDILKDRHPDLAVIFITGYPDQTLAEKARSLDATRFFTKPLDTDAILDCIDELTGAA
jgi:two-component system response regulator FixJ